MRTRCENKLETHIDSRLREIETERKEDIYYYISENAILNARESDAEWNKKKERNEHHLFRYVRSVGQCSRTQAHVCLSIGRPYRKYAAATNETHHRVMWVRFMCRRNGAFVLHGCHEYATAFQHGKNYRHPNAVKRSEFETTFAPLFVNFPLPIFPALFTLSVAFSFPIDSTPIQRCRIHTEFSVFGICFSWHLIFILQL